MALNLSRNSRLFVSTVKTGFTDLNTWEIAIQDGFSFSQAVSSTDITVNEAGATPNRGSKTFNTALDPAEWSFTTYARPFMDTETTPNHQAVERILWAGLAAAQTPDFLNSGNAVTGAPTVFSVGFDSSNVHELLKLNLYFQVDNLWYLIEDCQVGQVDMDFSIDGITTLAWSGQGTKLIDITAGTHPDPATIADVPATAAYLKNKLSTLALAGNLTGQNDDGVSYNIAITGGSLSISNNITYLTPETLSVVDAPIGSFTGSRSISGSLTCYLNTQANGSSTLANNLLTNTSTVNSYTMLLSVGGPTAPKVTVNLPAAFLKVPTTDVQDVVGLSLEFMGQGTTGIDATDELTISYYAS